MTHMCLSLGRQRIHGLIAGSIVASSLTILAGCQGIPTKGMATKAMSVAQRGGDSLAQATPLPYPETAVAQASADAQQAASQGVVTAEFMDDGTADTISAEHVNRRSVASHVRPASSDCTCRYQSVFPSFANGTCSDSATGSCPTGLSHPWNHGYRDPQEYVFDGGDHQPCVTVNEDGSVSHLDPEDTVIHFETERGAIGVEPACRAAIYAPRFGAVRKITHVMHQELALTPLAADQPQHAGALNEQLPPLTQAHHAKITREHQVKVIESFRDRNRGIPYEHILPVQNVSDALLPFEDLQLIRYGRANQADSIRLRRGVAAALAWSNVESLEVLIEDKSAQVHVQVKEPAETVLYELGGKPRVRICKIASDQVAQPGDIVDFTIRFDNVGSELVKNMVILDSLPPRLEYVESSQKSSLKANFTTHDNAVGSSTLRWEIDANLKPGEGGILRFRCQVR
jgi:uncharacterized repeat protein (TIGR01451 family)